MLRQPNIRSQACAQLLTQQAVSLLERKDLGVQLVEDVSNARVGLRVSVGGGTFQGCRPPPTAGTRPGQSARNGSDGLWSNAGTSWAKVTAGKEGDGDPCRQRQRGQGPLCRRHIFPALTSLPLPPCHLAVWLPPLPPVGHCLLLLLRHTPSAPETHTKEHLCVPGTRQRRAAARPCPAPRGTRAWRAPAV